MKSERGRLEKAFHYKSLAPVSSSMLYITVGVYVGVSSNSCHSDCEMNRMATPTRKSIERHCTCMPRTRSEIFPIMHRIIVHLFTMVKVNALSVSIGNRQCYVFLMPLKMISVSPTAFPPCDLVNLRHSFIVLY